MNLLQTNYWNNVANEKNFYHKVDLTFIKNSIAKESAILDYGCGYGRTLVELKEVGYQTLFGMDYSIAMLKNAKKKHAKLNVIATDGLNISFADSSIDCLLMVALLTCNPYDDQQIKITEECYRVLKPGGTLYIIDWLIQHDARNVERYKKYTDKHGCYGIFELADGAILRHHSKNHIEKLLKKFQTVRWRNKKSVTMNKHPCQIFEYIGTKVKF